MKKFLNKLDSAQSLLKNQERKRVMVVFTDKKYNIKDLKNEFGEPTDRETVVKNLHQVTNEIIIVINDNKIFWIKITV